MLCGSGCSRTDLQSYQSWTKSSDKKETNQSKVTFNFVLNWMWCLCGDQNELKSFELAEVQGSSCTVLGNSLQCITSEWLDLMSDTCICLQKQTPFCFWFLFALSEIFSILTRKTNKQTCVQTSVSVMLIYRI